MRCFATLLTLVLFVSLATAMVLGLVSGCVSYKSDTPLVMVGDVGYGGESARPDPGNIPPGPEHSVCHAELDKAIRWIEKLEKALKDCKGDREEDKEDRERDRRRDKEKWEAEKKKLEREKDLLKDERDMWKKRWERLRD